MVRIIFTHFSYFSFSLCIALIKEFRWWPRLNVTGNQSWLVTWEINISRCFSPLSKSRNKQRRKMIWLSLWAVKHDTNEYFDRLSDADTRRLLPWEISDCLNRHRWSWNRCTNTELELLAIKQVIDKHLIRIFHFSAVSAANLLQSDAIIRANIDSDWVGKVKFFVFFTKQPTKKWSEIEKQFFLYFSAFSTQKI